MYDSRTIEQEYVRGDINYIVYEHGIYGAGSVNEGLASRTYLGSYITVEGARRAYPDACLIEGSTKQEHHMPICPPAWFDSDYAGETW